MQVKGSFVGKCFEGKWFPWEYIPTDTLPPRRWLPPKSGTITLQAKTFILD